MFAYILSDIDGFLIISRGAEGPGQEIWQHRPSVCPSVCLSVHHI